MKSRIIFVLLAGSLLLSSCNAYHKLAYLQDMQVGADYPVQPQSLARIQVNDKLRIVVTCSAPEVAAPFNVVTGMASYDPESKSVKQNNVSLQQEGYLVDQEGNITFPVIGKLHVQDLTLDELKSFLEGQLKGRNYIKDPMVYVEFCNFSVYVIGEAGVGVVSIPTGGINMFELIAKSGDLKPDAIRNDIRVIRVENGIRKSYSINLQSVSCFDSPVFYLKQNDIVYALPKNNKIDQSGASRLTVVSVCTSAVSVISNILLWITLRNR